MIESDRSQCETNLIESVFEVACIDCAAVQCDWPDGTAIHLVDSYLYPFGQVSADSLDAAW